MTVDEAALLAKITKFQFDELGTQFTFAKRLARENGWPEVYTSRVITEYKRFLFLCCVSADGVTPPDAVDQAWHLHLTYTKSYWISLCQDTLNKQIHHNPTKGGSKEAVRFKNYYDASNRRYIEYFKTEPPADIWKSSGERFSDINFQRVNLNKYWLIRKPVFTRRNNLYTLAILAILLFAQQSAWSIIVFPVIIIVVIVLVYRNAYDGNKKQNGRNEKQGDTGTGCGGGDYAAGDDYTASHHHSGHDGDSGCSSGCSGCSSSGCSGCGGD